MAHPVLSLGLFSLLFTAVSSLLSAEFRRDPRVIPDSKKFTVSQKEYSGLKNPNPHGWYYKCANIVLAKDGALIASWQLSDNHTSLTSYIMTARSTDGGRSWGEYQTLAHANVWEHQQVWSVPQMSVLRDGRIVIVSDRGQRSPGQDWPMLAQWQKPSRGMSNHLFWSHDNGRTWSGPEQIDTIGGQPGYILETADGTLAFTRTESAETDRLTRPPLPWGNIYYRNAIVFSEDGGKTWGRRTWLADSPFHGDCEVGLAELAPGKLVAASRIGLGNGRFGHPSRLLFSEDNGRSWTRAVPAPFYGQRVHLGKLQSGHLLATYRNVWGTPGTRALIFNPEKDAGFQPTAFILDESVCELSSEALTLRTDQGQQRAAEFSFYPAEDHRARVEISATFRIESTDVNGVAISVGCWIQFLPDRVQLAAQPHIGFALDTRGWHTYQLIRENGTLRIRVNGEEKLNTPVGERWVREVRVGNRQVSGEGERYSRNQSISHWRKLAVKVENKNDYAIDWTWTPAQGYPDQFRRDRVVQLDNASAADCGYSSWTQLPDGTIAIVDYTTADLRSFHQGKSSPMIRSYLVTEKDLTH